MLLFRAVLGPIRFLSCCFVAGTTADGPDAENGRADELWPFCPFSVFLCHIFRLLFYFQFSVLIFFYTFSFKILIILGNAV